MSKNSNKEQWSLNDSLLTSYLLANMTDTISLIHGGDATHSIWTTIHDQLLPNSKDNEAQLKNNLYSLTKGTLPLDEYIRKFKAVCDKLATIGKPFSNVDKVFQTSKELGNK